MKNSKCNATITMEGAVKMSVMLNIEGLKFSSSTDKVDDNNSRHNKENVELNKFNIGFNVECDIKDLKASIDAFNTKMQEAFKEAVKNNSCGPNGPDNIKE